MSKLSPRDKARWIGLAIGLGFMVLGVFFPAPLMIWGKPVTDNAFLAVGFIGVLLTFGVVQLVKAWKGDKQ